MRPTNQHSVHMHTITHQHSNYLTVLSTSPYLSISITSRYRSNSNLNLSTVSAASSFPERPFHALTTLNKSPLPYYHLTSPPLYSQAIAPGPITVYSILYIISEFVVSCRAIFDFVLRSSNVIFGLHYLKDHMRCMVQKK